MTAVSGLGLKEWFGENVRSYLGVNPVSISPQPVHALSTFFATSLEIDAQRRLAELARIVATKDGLWAVSAEALRTNTHIQLPSSDHELEQLRHALAGLLAADRAVYKSPFSFQLAHIGLAARDRTDNGLGDLGARLVLSTDGGDELLERVVDRLFERQANPHWAVSSTLIGLQRESVSVAQPLPKPGWAVEESCAQFFEDVTALLARALVLIADGNDTLLSLRVLASSLTWVGLLTFAQVPALATQGRKHVLLVEAGAPGELPALRDASAGARIGLNGAWEQWLAALLAREVEDRFAGHQPTDDEMMAFLADCTPYTISGGSRTAKIQLQIPEVYSTWLAGHDPFVAAGHALEDMLTASMGDKPRKWFDAVGRHCGFVGPRRGHPARFRSEVSLLPTLVLAGLDDSDPDVIPMTVWLERLASRFGVVFGPMDLSRLMPGRAPEEDLEANREILSRLLASVGLARRYSDGVTEVLNISRLWGRPA